MRHPARKAALFAGATVIGAALLWFGGQRHAVTGGDWTSAVPSAIGFTLALVGLWLTVEALLYARGRARLLSGHRRVAAWRLPADSWERFRAFDGKRGASDSYRLLSSFWMRRDVPAEGIEVVVGETSVLLDDSYHVLRPGGLPELLRVLWLENGNAAGAPPDCLEFQLRYPRGRYGGMQLFSLRVPFPPSARAQARQVFLHYAGLLEGKARAAERDPRNNPKVMVAVFAAGVIASAAGWVSADATGWSTNETVVPLVLLVTGAVVTVLTGLYLLVLLLSARGGRRYR